MSDELYVCDRCEKEVDFESVGYLGNDSLDCNPFGDLECYCQDCYDRLEEKGR